MNTKKFSNIVLLFILPAIFIEIGYILFVQLTDCLNLPNINALALSVIFIMLPVELAIIGWTNKKEHGHFSIKNAVKYNKYIPAKKYFIFVPLLFLFMAVIFIAGKPIDEYLKNQFFSFIPERYILQLSPELYTKSQLIVTFISSFFITGIAAPIVEELYFRGFLLPRMEFMGKWAPIVNASLFALYHFWSPWQTPVRIIALIPLCYITYKTKNIKIAIITHCLLNIAGDSLSILFHLV